MDVAITGSSGLIGAALADRLLDQGHRPIAVVRRPARPGSDEIEWDPALGRIDAKSFEGIDAVVNLAGASVGGRRWNDAYIKTLTSSRVNGTTMLASTLAQLDSPPSVLLSGSAVGYYGNRGSEVLTEDSQPGDGVLAELCTRWEGATAAAADAGIRVATLRTGIVLAKHGGALQRMLPLFRLGLGGKFGDGTQYMPWITLDDEVDAIIYLLSTEISGPVNLTGPEPVTNLTFTTSLATVLRRPAALAVPAFAPRALLGRQMADALLFDSARVAPAVLLDHQFPFSHPDIATALRAVLDAGSPA